MDITLKQIRYFIALAETGHFGRAAERVHVTQPALSVQIREMESRLGARLLERHPRALVLTPAGHRVLEHGRKMMAQLRNLRDAARSSDDLSGALAIGVIPTVAPYLLPAAIPVLQGEYPALDLRIRESRTHVVLEELAQGKLDAAVIALPYEMSGTVCKPLFRDRFLLAGAGAQMVALAGEQDQLRPSAVDPDMLLLLEEGHCLADQALDVCSLDRAATRVDLSASSLGTLCRLVAEGLGMTFLPELALACEVRAVPTLSVLRFSDPEPERQIGLVRRAGSGDGPWFDHLARMLSQAGQGIVAATRLDG